eukprot:Protomagalhaensia_wolfi_Nauph_80__1613@NODE_199_length_3207_cov_89_350694_g133_i3_p2_GENE_NODE_199_length_3207_cov_89_350694_g133_i3NODE_199_length_3207_cov_89_350694_g133_i3_p2_ORF_typecomplete_len305_score0_16_NODE_199_length_3207_cov_89_350694_g133_i321663080
MADFVVLREEEWANEQQRLLAAPLKGGREALWSEVSSVTTRLSSTQGEGIWEYVFSLPYNFTEVRSIRGKQARLTLWESLELFDICNDFVFILRVAAYMRHIKGYGSQTEINKLPIGYVSLAWLICIYMISLVAYFTRRWWLYHRISPKDSEYFMPFLSLVKIRQAGISSRSSLASLFMFERLVWTYQLAMRLLEDVPQVVVSTIYLLSFGNNPYIHFMIAYSLIMIVVTSYRMGSEFPILRTITLLFSRTPPVDSPVLAEGAPLRRHFGLVIAFNCFAWSLTHFLCIRLVPNKIWRRCKHFVQ